MPLSILVQLIQFILLLLHCSLSNVFWGFSIPCHHQCYSCSKLIHTKILQRSHFTVHRLGAKLRACYPHSQLGLWRVLAVKLKFKYNIVLKLKKATCEIKNISSLIGNDYFLLSVHNYNYLIWDSKEKIYLKTKFHCCVFVHYCIELYKLHDSFD